MTLEEFKELLKTTGFPVAYRSFPENDAPSLPFICYLVANSNNFIADGMVYQKADRILVELYTKQKDVESEDKVEQALSSFVWEKTETYIDDEQCYQILYEIEV